jgi:N-succinyldiaminopimelate aminotransferase
VGSDFGKRKSGRGSEIGVLRQFRAALATLGKPRKPVASLSCHAGVAAVPVSAFYQSDAPNHFVRFCFSKPDEVLDEALRRLPEWLGRD